MIRSSTRKTSQYLFAAGMLALALLLSASGKFLVISRSQTAQVGASQSAEIVVRVTNEIDCESEPQTHVYFDVTPSVSAEISVVDNGVRRTFNALGTSEEGGLDGYFGNGNYTAQVSLQSGFTYSGKMSLPFSVENTCDGNTTSTQQPATTTPVIPKAPIVSTTTITSAPTKATLPLPIVPTKIQDATSTATLPDVLCTNPATCAVLCNSANTATSGCAAFVSKEIISSTTLLMLANGDASSTSAIETFFQERQGVRTEVDSDQDGITDFDEVNVYFTNPHSDDTNNNGVPDGEELLMGTNPIANTGSSTASSSTSFPRIVYQDPSNYGATTSAFLSVATITPIATSTDQHGETHLLSIHFSGFAPENSYVTLYIFSDPIVVTVRADKNGAWSYTLNKELADGSHKIYSTITDTDGHVLAKSEPVPFVKKAVALTVGSTVLTPEEPRAPNFFSGTPLIMMVSLFILLTVISIIAIGAVTRKTQGSNETKEPPIIPLS